MQLVLGSGSPRRAALLEQLGLEFRVMPPEIDETPGPDESPADYVGRMAREKTDALRRRLSADDLVVCADTTVCVDDRILGKPADRAEGVAMLQALSGRQHEVLTAVQIASDREQEFCLVETIVKFRPLTVEECKDYWATGEPVDKAGGYGIQGRGAILVDSITGSYSNVVGLPLTETALMLRRFGIDCLKSPGVRHG